MKINYFSRKSIAFVLCVLLLCSMQASAACTAVYVGSQASDDGSIIIARSNDLQNVWANHVTITPAVENEPGRFMPVSADGSVQTEIPATTYKYTATPLMDTSEGNESAHDAAACTNEYGVSMTMSVTAFPNKAALKADPLVTGGVAEFAATDLVICQSKTAREAVDVLLKTIDEYGSSESNIAIIADQNEVWYVEMYTGHQYAAVKLPADKVSVFGNEYTLEYLSEYEDSITSKDLITLAEDNGFAVHDKNNEVNLFKTYSGDNVTSDYSHMRTWIGHQILAPSAFNANYSHDAMYPLCFTPDEKVSMEDVSEIMRDRFEETKYSPDETERIDMRVIGTDTALSAHILQVYPDLPAEMSCVSWVSSGPPVCGVFVPVSNDCVNVSDAYGGEQSGENYGNFDTDNYPYYTFKDLSTRCVGPDNYEVYGEPVQDYWDKAESNMFASMSKVLKEATKMKDADKRADYITSYCNDMQTKAFDDAKEILNTVMWEQNKNSNTLKIERNPETHQMTGKEVVIDPIKIDLDASKYKSSYSPFFDFGFNW